MGLAGFNDRHGTAPAGPGKHIVRCEIDSALVAKTDMTGLAPETPAKDWPPSKRRWMRVCEAEFMVYPQDAELVHLTEDPALNPVTGGALSGGQVIIRHKGAGLVAVVSVGLNPKPGLPVSVDVALRLGGKTFQCGTLWAKKSGDETSSNGGELTTDIGTLDPRIKEADILLTPDPKELEPFPGVDRLWGKEITLDHVEVSRQDLSGRQPADSAAGRPDGIASTNHDLAISMQNGQVKITTTNSDGNKVVLSMKSLVLDMGHGKVMMMDGTNITVTTQNSPSQIQFQNMARFDAQPPVVVETFPVSGAQDVAPGVTDIRVRFSNPMRDTSWSWCTAWTNSTPELDGTPYYMADGRTCGVRVRLEPGRTYAYWLNTENFHNFKDRAGQPAVPYLLIFKTK